MITKILLLNKKAFSICAVEQADTDSLFRLSSFEDSASIDAHAHRDQIYADTDCFTTKKLNNILSQRRF